MSELKFALSDIDSIIKSDNPPMVKRSLILKVIALDKQSIPFILKLLENERVVSDKKIDKMMNVCKLSEQLGDDKEYNKRLIKAIRQWKC